MNFEDERESLRSRQIYSPIFTKRIESFHGDFNEVVDTEEDKLEIADNAQPTIEKLAAEYRNDHFNIALNQSNLELKKKESEAV